MKMGETQASHLSFFTSMVEVMSAAFGGKKDENGRPSNSGPITEDLTKLDPQAYLARTSQLLAGNI